MHDVSPPAAVKRPLMQALQVWATVGPLEKYFPAAHVLVVHDGLPVSGWYVPGVQPGHGVVWPGRGWDVPILHVSHSVFPVADSYWPLAHGSHVWEILVPLQRVPAAHVLPMHDGLPVSVWYVPTAQAGHAIWPVSP